MRIALIFALAGVAAAAGGQALVDRVGTTGFVQLQAESFKALSPRQQSLAFYLSQASIAIDPINYDQNSRFGLRQKRLLEALVNLPPDGRMQILNFTKLFWANRGNHNEMTAQKFMPEFTFDRAQSGRHPGVECGPLQRHALRHSPHHRPRRTWTASWKISSPPCSTRISSP